MYYKDNMSNMSKKPLPTANTMSKGGKTNKKDMLKEDPVYKKSGGKIYNYR